MKSRPYILFCLPCVFACFGDKVKLEIEFEDPILQSTDTSNSTEETGSDSPPTDTASEITDLDGDGYPSNLDCDDTSSSVYPGAPELCNNIDDNCNALVDENAGDFWYSDDDEDGYGSTIIGLSCDPIAGGVIDGNDCDDNNPNIYPGNPAQIDGLDSDCDGVLDWAVTIYVAVDDDGLLCIDGNELGGTGGWTSGQKYEIWLPTGTHTIGINGWDVGTVITAAIGHLEISDGSTWVTDGTWRYDPNPETVGKQGWCSTTFDDSGWDLALDIGPIGDASNPWGNAPSIFPSNSQAHWIWDHFPVNLNTQYLRKEFSLP